MGFFSWKCAVSGESIAVKGATDNPEDSHAFLVMPDYVYEEKAYEGYGKFGGMDAYFAIGNTMNETKFLRDFQTIRDFGIKQEHGEWEGELKNPQVFIKVVKGKYYTGQKYEDLPKSEPCEFQGWFYDDNEPKMFHNGKWIKMSDFDWDAYEEDET